MEARNNNIISEPIRSHEAFLDDLRRLFNAPSDLLSTLADRIKPNLYEPLSDEDANELSNRFTWKVEELRGTATAIVYLRQRLIETGQSPTDAIVESRSLLDQQDLAKAREDEIADVLSYSEYEREESLAIDAFTGIPTFMNARLRPSFLTTRSYGPKLASGYLWTISYLDGEGEQRSITIGLTPGELGQLETAIERAKEQLDAMRRLVETTPTVEG